MHKTITRLAGCLLLALFLGCYFSASAQKTPSQIPLSEAVKEIEAKFKTQFAYEHGLLDNKFTTRTQLKGKSLEDVLKNVLYPNNLIFLYVSENTYSIVERNSAFFTGMAPGNPVATTAPKYATGDDTRTLRGRVIDENGTPIAYASVWVKGTNQANKTNDEGDFLLPAVKSSSIISISMVGYNSQEIMVGDQFKLFVKLLGGKTMLNEVNIISNGYQTLPKERSTGSAAVIGSKDIELHPQTNLLDRIEGLVPGVQINVLSGDRGFFYQSGSSTATTQVGLRAGTRTVGINDYSATIRGKSTLTGEATPLIVLDGAITELDLSTINPNDVENITFLKDAAAASIWGVRAANGVIVVTTKKGKKNQTPAVNFSTTFTFGEKPNINYYKTMTSAQQLGYEKELVNRGFLSAIPGTDYYSASYLVSPGTYLAQQLAAGTISQSQYNAQVASLSAIDNRSQISKYFYQGEQSQQYNFSINGGSENSNYYYGVSYSRERPTEVRDNGKRLTATFNNSWKLFNWATLSTSLKGSFFNLVNNGMNLYSLYTPSSSTLMPYEQIADANGNGISYDRLNPAYTSTLSSKYKNWQYNYLNELGYNDNTEKDNNYIFNINLKVPIYKGLSASGTYANERTFSAIRTYQSPDSYYMRNILNYFTYPTAISNSLGISNGGYLNEVNTNQNNYSVRAQLDYNYTFGKHQITALAGTEMRETNAGQNSLGLWGYNTQTGTTNSNINFSSTPTYTYIAGFSPTDVTGFYYGGYPSATDMKRRFLSYFGNAAYTYNNKYIISGSVRYDDYNNFGLDRKYRATPLWSSGLKWNINQEEFLKDVRWIDQLALRASYGVNGNLSLSTYPYTYISLGGSADPTTGQTYASLIAPANPQLRWEKTYVTNFGVDFGLFGNRLNGSVDIYNKKSNDLLYSFPTGSAYLGNTSPFLTRNAASMKNHGIDVGLNGTIFKNKDWDLGAGATFAYNTNKVTNSYFNQSLYVNYYGYYPAGISYLTGYPTDKLFVYRNAGLDANGLTQIYDHNGNIVKASQTTLSSLSDLKYAGRTTAPYYGGFNTNFRYKRFSLFSQFTYQFGNVFLKPSIQNYITSAYSAKYDLSADIAQRWQAPGDEAKTVVPGLNGTPTQVNYSLYRYQYSDINVLKGDYIRMRQLTLNYQLAGAWMSKFKIKSAQVGATANNLGLLWTANKEGYDPDFTGYVGGQRGLPAARSYTLNINLNF